jgi:trehalose 6-phosphate phosphatase
VSRRLDFHTPEEVLAAARRKLARAGALLFLDYDGTLTPIVRRPEEALLPEGARRLLESLSAAPGCRVAIVSGRRLDEVRDLVGLPGLAYAGNHGLEMAWPGGEWVHPEARGVRAELEALKGELPPEAWPGVWVEDKGLTLTVHYRQAEPAVVPELSEVLARLLEPRAERLLVRSGKMSYEVRPRLDWDKGQAVLKLAGLLAPGGGWGLFYAGDDATDEDAFRVLGEEGLGVLVGERRETYAGFCLPDSRALLELLAALDGERPWAA